MPSASQRFVYWQVLLVGWLLWCAAWGQAQTRRDWSAPITGSGSWNPGGAASASGFRSSVPPWPGSSVPARPASTSSAPAYGNLPSPSNSLSYGTPAYGTPVPAKGSPLPGGNPSGEYNSSPQSAASWPNSTWGGYPTPSCGSGCGYSGQGFRPIPVPPCTDFDNYPPYVGPPQGWSLPPVVWSFDVGVQLFDVVETNQRSISVDSANVGDDVLTSRQTDFDIGPGFEASVARFDPNNQFGVEVRGWTMTPRDAIALLDAADVAGDLNTNLNFEDLDYDGASADNNTEGAAAHQLLHEFCAHSLEFNGYRMYGNLTDRSSWLITTLGGLRLIRIEDQLDFSSDPVDNVFNGADEELTYATATLNHLVGLQVGGSAESPRYYSDWRMIFSTKLGIFHNSVTKESLISGGAGTATVNTGGDAGEDFDLTDSISSFSLMGELQAGTSCSLGGGWEIDLTYRLMGFSGVALATQQAENIDLSDLDASASASADSNVFLHGALINLRRRY